MFRIDTLAKLTLSTGLAATLALVPLAGCASSGDAPQDVAPAAEDTTDAAEPTEAKDASEATPVWVASSYKMIQVDLEGNEGEYSSTYELDEAGNMIREVDNDASDSEDEPESFNYAYTYDEDGWLTKVEMGDETWEYELEKDEQGRVVTEKSKDFRVEYSYNEQGFVSESRATSIVFTVDESSNGAEGPEEKMTITTTYDEGGFTLTRSHDYQDGRSETVYAYEYGDDGLPVSYTATTKDYDSDGNEIEGSETTMSGTIEYDEHGNIVKVVLEDEFGTTTSEYGYVEIANPSLAVRIQGHTKNV
jgi:YD repeat-containing protein